MTEREQTEEHAERSERILSPPTANPARVKVPPEGLKQQTDDGDRERPRPPEEEA